MTLPKGGRTRRVPLTERLEAALKAHRHLVRHQELTTTQQYMHLLPAHKDAAIRLLDRRPVDDEHDAGPASQFGDGLETTPSGGVKPNEVRQLGGGGAGNRNR